MATRVLVLNNDYSFLNVCSVNRAITLVYQNKAEIIKASDRILSNFESTFKIFRPLIIRLLKFVRQVFRNKVPYSKSNIITRDGACVYCGSMEDLTVDHIIPRSRGGKSSWENCACACNKCNNRKGDKTPREANMFMKKQPYTPTITEFIQIKMKMYGFESILTDLLR